MMEDREADTVRKMPDLDSCVTCTTKLSSSAEPKLLPCLHLMCKACTVNKHAKECPVCHQSFKLSEVTDCYIFEDSAPKCGGCDDSALSGWCKECDEALCPDCVSAHQRVKMTRNHTVVPQEPQSGLSTSMRCALHIQERLKFFCVTCDRLTCRDCQLIDHRNHSFLLLEEAVVSQKDQLIKLVNSISEQTNSVRARLHDLDARLNELKELKASSKKQLHNALRSLYVSLMLRGRQLSKELESLCDEEEKSLTVMKTSLKKLEDREEYIAAFARKILSTEGYCVLQHKMQIEKWAQKIQAQKKVLPHTVIQFSLSFNENIHHSIKNLGSFKVTRVPCSMKRQYNIGNKPKNIPDKRSSGLNSDSGATRLAPDGKSFQPTLNLTSQDASDFPQNRQYESSSSKPVQLTQGLTDTMSHISSSSSSHNFASPKTTWSSTVQCPVVQVGQHLPHPVSHQPSKPQEFSRSQPLPFQSPYLPQSSSSLSSHTSLNISPSHLPQHLPQVVPPQSQSGVAAASPRGPTSNSYSLNSNRSVSTLCSLAALCQSSQAMPYPHPSIQKFSSNHTQKSVPQSQAVNSQSFPSQLVHNKKSLPYSQAVSNTQSVNLQPSQSVGTPSNRVQLILPNIPKNMPAFKSDTVWKFYHYTPLLNLNKGVTMACVPQPAKMGDVDSSKKVSCPQAPRPTILPVGSNIELNPPLSSTLSLPAAPISSVSSNTGQTECATQMIQLPISEPPVKAPADSVCERDTNVCSSASPVAEEKEEDSNLPTSTMPEKDTKAEELSEVHQPGDLLSTTSIKDCFSNQNYLEESESSRKCNLTLSSTEDPSSKSWLVGLPSSFREILCKEKEVEHASLPNAMSPKEMDVMKISRQYDSYILVSLYTIVYLIKSFVFLCFKQDDDEKTDDSDSELVEGMDESKKEPKLKQDSHKTLRVSLLRLPISGSSTSPFRIVPSSRKTEILLQEIEENQHTAGCVGFNLIVGRLLGKRSPPYRSAAELVSDLWALLDNLSSKSKKKDLVVKLQSSFQCRLNVLFGERLHASLLRPLSGTDQTVAPKTKSEQEKAKRTLKRMKEYLAANSPIVAKKANTENT
ncbi:E3 ubiquitin-protein ligase TRIM33 isoform X1 [Silurus meridionalis]|nr:E3 ubiquitin-protein ligase TRIM33 isoform X1 [Silurus meridionalis]